MRTALVRGIDRRTPNRGSATARMPDSPKWTRADAARGRPMATFATLHARLARDTEALHDFLWHGKKDGAEALREQLLADARELDLDIGARGKLRRSADLLAKRWGEAHEGESLFELLEHTWNLHAAVIHAGRKEYRAAKGCDEGAVGHAASVAESASIGVCANAGCFEFVEEWEGGKIDFDSYASKLAGFLEGKGITRAAEWRRMLLVARAGRKAWDASAPAPEQALAARTSIGAAGWVALAAHSIRLELRSPPKFPYGDYAAIVAKII